MRKLILLVTALLPMAVMGQKSTLTLTLTGLEPGAGLVVSEALDGRLVPADTLYLDAKGTVKMTRQATEPVFFVKIWELKSRLCSSSFSSMRAAVRGRV